MLPIRFSRLQSLKEDLERIDSRYVIPKLGQGTCVFKAKGDGAAVANRAAARTPRENSKCFSGPPDVIDGVIADQSIDNRKLIFPSDVGFQK